VETLWQNEDGPVIGPNNGNQPSAPAEGRKGGTSQPTGWIALRG
jgi:hypothetical protein